MKNEKDNKRKYLHKLYLSEDEKFKLSGMNNRNSFLRHLILYGFVYDVDYSELQENNYQLGKIGNNINQVIHLANATGTITPNQINEVKELMEKVWQLQESMLSKQPSIKQ